MRIKHESIEIGTYAYIQKSFYSDKLSRDIINLVGRDAKTDVSIA